MSQQLTQERSIILAGPPGANLLGTAYPVLRHHRIPVRLVVADQKALTMVVEANPTDRLFLMPDLFPSVEAAGSFLDSLPETISVLIGLPLDWSSNVGAVESHLRIEGVRCQPFDWHDLARTLVNGQQGEGDSLASSSDASTEGSRPQTAMENAGTREDLASTPQPEGPDEMIEQAPVEQKRPSAPHRVRHPVAIFPPCDNVIAVWSGAAGGTGKSTVAANKALQLSRAGRSVILLAFGGAARHMRLGGEGAGAFAARPDESGFRDGLVSWHGLPIIPPPANFRVAARMEEMNHDQPGSIGHLIRFAAGRFELVAVDCPPGTGSWALQPLLAAAVVLLVTRPTIADQTAMARALNLLKRIRKDGPFRVRLALNDIMPGDPDSGTFRQGLGTILGDEPPPVMGRILHHPNVRRAQNEGLPLAMAEGLEGVTTGIEAIPTPWGPAESDACKNGRGRRDAPGREINLGVLKVKVVN